MWFERIPNYTYIPLHYYLVVEESAIQTDRSGTTSEVDRIILQE